MALIPIIFAFGLLLISAAHVRRQRAETVALATVKCAVRNLPNTPKEKLHA